MSYLISRDGRDRPRTTINVTKALHRKFTTFINNHPKKPTLVSAVAVALEQWMDAEEKKIEGHYYRISQRTENEDTK